MSEGQPPLPEGIPWPDYTIAWWATIGATPEVASWTPAQWQFLLDTALLHSDVWSGNLDRLPELRTRLHLAGLTPDAKSAATAGKGGSALDQLAARRAHRGADPARTRRPAP